MLMTTLFFAFCLGFLIARIAPKIARGVRNYLYVPQILRPYKYPDSRDTDKLS